MQDVSVGCTFPLIDPSTGRQFVGWGQTLDAAIADALHQLNEATRTRLSVAAAVRRYMEGIL